jgi:site-specific DNA recombinase
MNLRYQSRNRVNKSRTSPLPTIRPTRERLARVPGRAADRRVPARHGGRTQTVKRCAIYARYSSDLQSATSLDDQQRLCHAYGERQNWTVVSLFEDAALSGFGVDHRQGYQQLLAAALSSPASFDVVLVEDLSRLTRDMAELMGLSTRLRLKGIELVGVSDGIATSRQGAKMHLAVKGLVNELYLDDLRDKTHRGLSGAVTRGLSAGGRLYGYRTVPVTRQAKPSDRGTPARFEVDSGEAEIVRRSSARTRRGGA